LKDPYKLFLFLFIFFCSSNTTYEYEVNVSESYSNSEIIGNVETKLLYTVQESDDTVTLQVQSFPKISNQILSYSLVFDLKFRENYQTDTDSLCVGPVWNGFGPGEVSINLNKSNNFTNSVTGKVDKLSNDGCNNYYYYLRFLTIFLESGEKIYVGVATDYAQNYPDAPYIWLVNKNNQIEELGTSKIEKYSLNFELSK